MPTPTGRRPRVTLTVALTIITFTNISQATVTLSAGYDASVLVSPAGTIRGWGVKLFTLNPDANWVNTPTAESTLTNVVSLVTNGGYGHGRVMVALKSDGTVWCSNYNRFGQLGDGNGGQVDSYSLTPVRALNLTGVTAIAAGTAHVLALKSDGTLMAWGSNMFGEIGDGTQQIGDGTDANRLIPTAVQNLTRVRAIAAGKSFSWALREDGSVWAWGSNNYGVLGVSYSQADSANVPTPIPTLSGVTAIAAGNGTDSYGMALKADGTVWLIGRNTNTNPTSTTSQETLYSPIQVANLTGIVAIAAGGDHCLALKNDGTVWAWGDNGSGQLGDGTLTDRTTAAQVPGLTRVVSIAAGTCHSLALRADGSVWAWGENSYGSVGNGTYVDVKSPVQVATNVALPSDDPPAKAIKWVSTTRGAVGGDVTLSLWGVGLADDATVSLVRGATSIAATVLQANNGRFTVRFDLTGATAGEYALIVTNPGGVKYTADAPFVIEQNARILLSGEVMGRDLIAIRRSYRYTLRLANTGNVDAHAVMIVLRGIASDTTWTAITPFTDPWNWPSDVALAPDDFPVTWNNNGETLVPIVVSHIPAGGEATFEFELMAETPDNGAAIEMDIYEGFGENNDLMSGWGFAGDYTSSGTDPVSAGCVGQILSLALDTALNTAFPGDCESLVKDLVVDTARNIDDLRSDSPDVQFYAMGQLVPGWMLSGLKCAASAGVTTITPWASVAMNGIDLMKNVITGADLITECSETFRQLAQALKGLQILASLDPNAKVGPDGVGDNHAITADQSMAYVIYFENKSDATAPAQEVTITDTLDLTKFDAATFELGDITLGETTITVPGGQTLYTQTIDLSATIDVHVKIDAAFDTVTGKAVWKFTAIDPDTGTLPEDPTVGLLPPNVTSPEGEGCVRFRVKPLATLASGTELTNLASIVFDLNDPIVTDATSNVIDADLPVSAVTAMSATTAGTTISVAWTASDTTSGVAHVDLWVSDNGGAYTRWQNNLTTSPETFTGEIGHTYRFYSVATDRCGHSEAAPNAPDAQTQLVAAGSNGNDDPTDDGACCSGLATILLAMLALSFVSLTGRRE